MKNISKKIISLSLITAISLGVMGCSEKEITPPDLKDTKFDKKIKNQVSRIRQKTDHTKPIERIYVDNFVYKQDNINHDIPDIKLKVSFTRSMTLQEFSKRIGFPAVVEDSIAQREICFNGVLEGSAKKVLTVAASMANVYWTYDNGVIKFTRTKNIIYSFPFFSMERLQTVYNTGENGKDPINVELKKDIFEELEDGLKISLDEVTFQGTVKESWNEKEDYEKKNSNKHTKNGNTRESKDKTLLKDFTKSNSNTEDIKGKKTYLNKSGSKLEKSKSRSKKKSKTSSMKITPELSEFAQEDNTNTNSKNYKNINSDKSTDKSKKLTSNEIINGYINQEDTGVTRNKERTLDFTTTYGDSSSKISISKEMGVVFAKLTPSEEKRATNLIKNIIKKHFSTLIVVDTYILTVDSEKVKDYSLEFGALIQNGLIQSSLSLAGSSLQLSRDSLTLPTTPGSIPTSGEVLSGVINYFIGDSSGEVLSEPKLVTMPNIPARIKDTKYYPYVKPQQITGDAGNTVSYDLANVEEGIDLTVLPTVLSDDTIFLSVGLGINQYLGDKTIQAGIAGTFNLPQQAPKRLNTTFRIKPGDVIVLGGIKSSSKSNNEGSQVYVPTGDAKRQASSDFIIVAMPRLIKFVEEKDRKSEEAKIKREEERYKKQHEQLSK